MMEPGMLRRLVLTVAGFGIWFVLLVFVGSAVLKSRAVLELGFAVYPFSVEFYPMGLAWFELIRVALFTVIAVFVLMLGARLRGDLPLAFPSLHHLGGMAYCVSLLASLILVFISYDYLIVPLLEYQGVGWIYNVVFSLGISGIVVRLAFESVQMALSMRKTGVATADVVEATSNASSTRIECEQCGASIDSDDCFCRQCGARVKLEEQEEE